MGRGMLVGSSEGMGVQDPDSGGHGVGGPVHAVMAMSCTPCHRWTALGKHAFWVWPCHRTVGFWGTGSWGTWWSRGPHALVGGAIMAWPLGSCCDGAEHAGIAITTSPGGPPPGGLDRDGDQHARLVWGRRRDLAIDGDLCVGEILLVANCTGGPCHRSVGRETRLLGPIVALLLGRRGLSVTGIEAINPPDTH